MCSNSICLFGFSASRELHKSKIMSTVEIYMGFQPVKFDHSLMNEEQKRCGAILHNLGRIYNVIEITGPGLSRVSQIRALFPCRFMNEPYSIIMELDELRKVTSATCTCNLGMNGLCKHVYALSLHINIRNMHF